MQKPNYFKGDVAFTLSTIWKTTSFSRNRANKRKWALLSRTTVHIPHHLNMSSCSSSNLKVPDSLHYLISRCPKRQETIRTLISVPSSWPDIELYILRHTEHFSWMLRIWQSRIGREGMWAEQCTQDFVEDRLQSIQLGKQGHTTLLILPSILANFI